MSHGKHKYRYSGHLCSVFLTATCRTVSHCNGDADSSDDCRQRRWSFRNDTTTIIQSGLRVRIVIYRIIGKTVRKLSGEKSIWKTRRTLFYENVICYEYLRQRQRMVGCETVGIASNLYRTHGDNFQSLWVGFEAFKALKSLESVSNLSSPWVFKVFRVLCMLQVLKILIVLYHESDNCFG